MTEKCASPITFTPTCHTGTKGYLCQYHIFCMYSLLFIKILYTYLNSAVSSIHFDEFYNLCSNNFNQQDMRHFLHMLFSLDLIFFYSACLEVTGWPSPNLVFSVLKTEKILHGFKTGTGLFHIHITFLILFCLFRCFAYT